MVSTIYRMYLPFKGMRRVRVAGDEQNGPKRHVSRRLDPGKPPPSLSSASAHKKGLEMRLEPQKGLFNLYVYVYILFNKYCLLQ